MARLGTGTQSSKSIAGAALVGVGLFILYEDMTGAIAFLSDVLGSNGSEALGIFPAVILATSKAVHSCAFDHHALLTGSLRMLLSFWPSLVVIVGTRLLRDTFSEKNQSIADAWRTPRKTNFKNKDTECRFRRSSFDA